MGLWGRIKSGIQIVVGGYSQGRTIVKGSTQNSGATRPKQGEEWLHAYNTMPWLRANVAKIAQGVSSLEWGITRTMDESGYTVKRPDIQKGALEYRRKALAALADDGQAEPIFDHPLLTLWKNPCPALPGGAARKLAQVYYEVSGEVFFVVDRGDRDGWLKGISEVTGRPLPTALWPVPPTWVKRVPTPDNPTFEIRYMGLQLDKIPMSEVLWLKDPDPVNPYSRGVGLFYSLSDELDSDENAAKMVSYSFYNRNRPDVLVSLPGADDKELQAFRNEWIANLQGVQNTLKSHFVNVEANVQQIGFDAREMQVAELRKSTRDTIRQVPGVPPEMLGIQDQSNRSTIEAAEYIFNKHVVEPRAETWREFLSSHLLGEYDPRAVLDYVSPSMDDKEFSLKVIARQPEFFRVNEVRKMAGQSAIPETEGGRMFFVNGTFVSNLMEAPPPAGAVPPGGAPGGGGPPTPGNGVHGIPGGGINVPGSPVMHLDVPGAQHVATQPQGPKTQPGFNADGTPAIPPDAPATVPAAPLPGLPKGVVKGGAVREAARAFRIGLAGAEFSPDITKLIATWERENDYDLRHDQLAKTAAIPVCKHAPTEWARRAIAYLNDRPTKGWDTMLGPWTEHETSEVDRILCGYETQPRDTDGKFATTGNAGAAGAGAARASRDQHVAGDGGHLRTSLSAFRDKWTKAGVDNYVSEHNGVLTLSRIVVPKKDRDQGLGSAFMSELVDLADKEGKTIALSPSKDFGASSVSRLKDFYKRFGFRSNTGSKQDFRISETMVREPIAKDHEPPVPGESDREMRRRMARNEARASRGKGMTKGDSEGHPFRGNQWTGGRGGADERALRERHRLMQPEQAAKFQERVVGARIRAEAKTPVPNPPAYNPDVEADKDGNGVTDAARVGIPGDEVLPPPAIPRLPNLTEPERRAESAFADAFEKDPDGVARKFLDMVKADPPIKFEADAAKMLFGPWQGAGLTEDQRADVRSTLNTALHQTADAIAKRAFLMHLDAMGSDDRAKGLLVTVGGCGAGKGFALKTLASAGFSDFNAKAYGVTWDSAGDQNATENPWLLDEARKRDIPVTFAYVSADPEVAWADPARGVVQRAKNPKDGRMVDAAVFADSYVIGARNHDAFAKAMAGHARFVYVSNGAKIEKLDGVPTSDLARDRRKLHEFALKTIKLGSEIPPRIKRGALVGQRIWGGRKS